MAPKPRIYSVRLWNVECKELGCWWVDGTDSRENAAWLWKRHYEECHQSTAQTFNS